MWFSTSGTCFKFALRFASTTKMWRSSIMQSVKDIFFFSPWSRLVLSRHVFFFTCLIYFFIFTCYNFTSNLFNLLSTSSLLNVFTKVHCCWQITKKKTKKTRLKFYCYFWAEIASEKMNNPYPPAFSTRGRGPNQSTSLSHIKCFLNTWTLIYGTYLK